MKIVKVDREKINAVPRLNLDEIYLLTKFRKLDERRKRIIFAYIRGILGE